MKTKKEKRKRKENFTMKKYEILGGMKSQEEIYQSLFVIYSQEKV